MRDGEAEAAIARVIDAVQQTRRFARRERHQARRSVLAARFEGLDGEAPLVARLARLTPTEGDDREPVAALSVSGGLVELLEGVDPAEAAARVEAARKTLQAEIKRAEGKLDNAGFVAKAPEAVVAAERAKLDQLRAELEGLG